VDWVGGFGLGVGHVGRAVLGYGMGYEVDG